MTGLHLHMGVLHVHFVICDPAQGTVMDEAHICDSACNKEHVWKACVSPEPSPGSSKRTQI